MDPRLSRQAMLPEVGEHGLARLRAARALVVGVGGLGCPAAQLLAGCGIGGLTLVDFDTVDLSNLHRQTLYGTADVGRPKAEAARDRLRASFPDVPVRVEAQVLDGTTADALVAGHAVALGCTDSLDSRYALSDACQRAGIPLVHAAVEGWQAELAVFPPGGPCYRCLHPASAPAPDCAAAGVMGPVPAVAGAWQALEAAKAVLGQAAVGGLTLWDGLEGSWQPVDLRPREGCPGCRQLPHKRP